MTNVSDFHKKVVNKLEIKVEKNHLLVKFRVEKNNPSGLIVHDPYSYLELMWVTQPLLFSIEL